MQLGLFDEDLSNAEPVTDSEQCSADTTSSKFYYESLNVHEQNEEQQPAQVCRHWAPDCPGTFEDGWFQCSLNPDHRAMINLKALGWDIGKNWKVKSK